MIIFKEKVYSHEDFQWLSEELRKIKDPLSKASFSFGGDVGDYKNNVSAQQNISRKDSQKKKDKKINKNTKNQHQKNKQSFKKKPNKNKNDYSDKLIVSDHQKINNKFLPANSDSLHNKVSTTCTTLNSTSNNKPLLSKKTKNILLGTSIIGTGILANNQYQKYKDKKNKQKALGEFMNNFK